mmetsp:Transcript_44779/g.95282  ORF Transcript_44779/g.95282 Transcript_44779/m.95282 type:complete len:98 (-) Transcript_44779:452-745(-)
MLQFSCANQKTNEGEGAVSGHIFLLCEMARAYAKSSRCTSGVRHECGSSGQAPEGARRLRELGPPEGPHVHQSSTTGACARVKRQGGRGRGGAVGCF